MVIAPNRAVIDPTTMQRLGGQLGSNPAGIFQDDAGRRYYVKTLDSPAHARNEWLAAQLYRLAGAPTLTYVATSAPEQIATEWRELDKKSIAHFSADQRRQAQRWFGVHAWTANWDAAGWHGDNQGVADGRVLTLDVGGALAFRAQGDPKGPAFGCRVYEIETLRHDPDNPHAVKLFQDMTRDALIEAMLIVVRLPDAAVSQTVIDHGGSPKLAEKMLTRKADMARRLREDYGIEI